MNSVTYIDSVVFVYRRGGKILVTRSDPNSKWSLPIREVPSGKSPLSMAKEIAGKTDSEAFFIGDLISKSEESGIVPVRYTFVRFHGEKIMTEDEKYVGLKDSRDRKTMVPLSVELIQRLGRMLPKQRTPKAKN